MGFLSNLLGAATQLLPGPLGAIAQVAGTALGIAAPTPSNLLAAAAPAQTTFLGPAPIQAPVTFGPRNVALQARARTGISGQRGNGQFVVDTIVETTDLGTGKVVRRKVLEGSPFLMNNDVRKLRQTAKKLGKANARLPRKTVKQSAAKELINAITQTALRRVLTGPGHGHHGGSD